MSIWVFISLFQYSWYTKEVCPVQSHRYLHFVDYYRFLNILKINGWSDKLLEGLKLKLKLRMDDVAKILQCGTPNP